MLLPASGPLACDSITPVFASVFPLRLCPDPPLLLRTPVIPDEGCTLLQDDIIVTVTSAVTPFPKKGTR